MVTLFKRKLLPLSYKVLYDFRDLIIKKLNSSTADKKLCDFS